MLIVVLRVVDILRHLSMQIYGSQIHIEDLVLNGIKTHHR